MYFPEGLENTPFEENRNLSHIHLAVSDLKTIAP